VKNLKNREKNLKNLGNDLSWETITSREAFFSVGIRFALRRKRIEEEFYCSHGSCSNKIPKVYQAGIGYVPKSELCRKCEKEEKRSLLLPIVRMKNAVKRIYSKKKMDNERALKFFNTAVDLKQIVDNLQASTTQADLVSHRIFVETGVIPPPNPPQDNNLPAPAPHNM
jgi:hypothetical protein